MHKVNKKLTFWSNLQLAAYPILIPLYLAQYENESMSTTVVLEAFTSDVFLHIAACGYYADSPLQRVYFELCNDSRLPSILANYVHSNYWQAGGPATPFSKVTMPSRKHSDILHKWLDNMISQPGGTEQLISGSPVDFADHRVREFTEEETTKNRDFLNVSTQVAELEHLLLKVTSVPMEYRSP
jgi:hypothetical protein